jgi:hypothetical protein
VLYKADVIWSTLHVSDVQVYNNNLVLTVPCQRVAPHPLLPACYYIYLKTCTRFPMGYWSAPQSFDSQTTQPEMTIHLALPTSLREREHPHSGYLEVGELEEYCLVRVYAWIREIRWHPQPTRLLDIGSNQTLQFGANYFDVQVSRREEKSEGEVFWTLK